MKKKGMVGILKDEVDGLDEPAPSGLFDFFKGGKLICKIIYEDGSYKDFYKKFGKSYTITIKKREYLVVPNCILRGKNNTIAWFFNNPRPIDFSYQQSTLSALDVMEEKKKKKLSDDEISILSKTTMDAEGLHSIFNTKLIQGLYPVDGLTTKSIIMYAVVGVILILFVLQLTGTVDVIGEFNRMLSGDK